MKTITFILPNSNANTPIGGVKVVYEYANRLVADGYNVNIIYPKYTPIEGKGIKVFLKNLYIKFRAWLNQTKINNTFRNRSWFDLDSRINEISTWDYKQKNVPESNIYIATMYNTAIALDKYKTNAKKFYLVQCFENFFISDQEFLDTLNLNLQNIAICDWLGDFCEQMGNPAKILYNGFDFNYFNLKNSIENRNPYSIAMMYNPDPWKGFNEAFEAVKKAKEIFPKLTVEVFGRTERPDFFPDWVNYTKQPNKGQHNEIYNKSAIFVIGSHNEGWGLPVGEAMICGCAIVCTDIGGFKAMAKENITALTSPIGDINKMSENIIKLLKNQEKRIELAKEGNRHIQQFTWDNAYNKLKKIIFE